MASIIDDLFVFTILLIFALTLLGGLVRRLSKDKCLKLMHDHHVTYLAPDAPAVWGDMFVFSQGVQIVFDSPFVNSRDLSKSGFLIYEDEILKAVAICRTVLGLTEQVVRKAG